MAIKTELNPKPIPNRNFDWEAWDEDTEKHAFGATEAEAIANLREKLGEDQ